jgi:hypothetical protein
VRDAQLIQARGPGLQLIAVTTGEGNMIQAGTMLVEPVTCGPGVRMQAEQLPAAEREYGVVKSSGLLVLVENGPGGQQPAVPAKCFAPDQSPSQQRGRSTGTQAQRPPD